MSESRKAQLERIYDLLFQLPDGRVVNGRYPGRVKQGEVITELAERYPETVDTDMGISSWPWWMMLADLEPADGMMLQVQIASRGGSVQELYGCPTAVIPQREILTGCRVEEIRLDGREESI